MKEYVVLADNGVVLEGPDDTVHAKGTVLELDPANQQVIDLLANETLGEVMPDSETEDFVVTEEFLAANQAIADAGVKVGETIRVPKVVADDAAQAAAEPAAEEVVADEVVEDEGADPIVAEKLMKFQGQDVISHSMRDVNDKSYHHVRLADGSEQDISDEEYDAMVASFNQ